MVVRRGEIWWADLPAATGSGPGFRRPVVVLQSNDFNASAIRTVVIVIITSNLLLASAPGNVQLTMRQSKLKRKSVINVSQILTVDKSILTDRVVSLPEDVQNRIDEGLRTVLALK
jgi:mRNA interferase MazF